MAQNQRKNVCAQGCKAAAGRSLFPTIVGQCRYRGKEPVSRTLRLLFQ